MHLDLIMHKVNEHLPSNEVTMVRRSTSLKRLNHVRIMHADTFEKIAQTVGDSCGCHSRAFVRLHSSSVRLEQNAPNDSSYGSDQWSQGPKVLLKKS